MSKKINLIADQAAFDAALVSVKKTASKMEGEVQMLLVSAMAQALQHGNTNWLNAIPHALGKGVRLSAVGAWILAHAPVVSESDKEKAKESPFRFSRDKLGDLLGDPAVDHKTYSEEQIADHITKAHGVHWTTFKPDTLVPESFDLGAAIAALVKKAKGMQGKNVKIVGQDKLGDLEALCATPDVQGV